MEHRQEDERAGGGSSVRRTNKLPGRRRARGSSSHRVHREGRRGGTLHQAANGGHGSCADADEVGSWFCS